MLWESGELRAVFTLVLIGGTVAWAQPDSRRQEVEQARDEKATHLEADEPNKWERRLIFFKDQKVLERVTAGIGGLRAKIGGMPTGSGFALGPDYYRGDLLRGNLTFNATATGSMKGWYKIQTLLSAPAFGRNKLYWDLMGTHQDYNSMFYYGDGPDSQKSGRSSYRLEDTSFDSLLGVKLHKYLRLSGSAGYLMTNVGPGKSDDYVRADIAYPNVPGMRVQTNYLRIGGIAQIDYRDQQAGARSGGNYVARFDNFDDQEGRGYTFRRLDLEAQQFIPFFNKRRVIALRARSLQTFASGGQQLPFYQQAVLGGDDLRGYRPYRFYDNNMMVFSAEYRWEIFSGLDGAVFADAGQVSKRRWQVNLDSMESAVGFGLRFNVRNAPFLRVDVGFSHEGFQVFLKFKEVWAQRPRSTSSAPHIF